MGKVSERHYLNLQLARNVFVLQKTSLKNIGDLLRLPISCHAYIGKSIKYSATFFEKSTFIIEVETFNEIDANVEPVSALSFEVQFTSENISRYLPVFLYRCNDKRTLLKSWSCRHGRRVELDFLALGCYELELQWNGQVGILEFSWEPLPLGKCLEYGQECLTLDLNLCATHFFDTARMLDCNNHLNSWDFLSLGYLSASFQLKQLRKEIQSGYFKTIEVKDITTEERVDSEIAKLTSEFKRSEPKSIVAQILDTIQYIKNEDFGSAKESIAKLERIELDSYNLVGLALEQSVLTRLEFFVDILIHFIENPPRMPVDTVKCLRSIKDILIKLKTSIAGKQKQFVALLYKINLAFFKSKKDSVELICRDIFSSLDVPQDTKDFSKENVRSLLGKRLWKKLEKDSQSMFQTAELIYRLLPWAQDTIEEKPLIRAALINYFVGIEAEINNKLLKKGFSLVRALGIDWRLIEGFAILDEGVKNELESIIKSREKEKEHTYTLTDLLTITGAIDKIWDELVKNKHSIIIKRCSKIRDLFQDKVLQYWMKKAKTYRNKAAHFKETGVSLKDIYKSRSLLLGLDGEEIPEGILARFLKQIGYYREN